MAIRGKIDPSPAPYFNLNLFDGIVFAKRENRDLKMRLLTPLRGAVGRPAVPQSGFDRNEADPEYFGVLKRPQQAARPQPEPLPAVVFVGGTGFAGSAGFTGLAKFAELAMAGFIVAGIDYRGAQLDNTRFPDCIQDCKEAVRFLRANAETYCIDPERIALMGTSSGGYCVTMAAITEGDAEFDLGEHLEYSSAVQALVDCFGPQDFGSIVEDRVPTRGPGARFSHEAYALFRNDVIANPALLDKASTVYRVKNGAKVPPTLIMHGTADTTVPPRQSERLYEAMAEAGCDVRFFEVEGATHEGSFWCPETMAEIVSFLKEKLKAE